MKFDIDFDNLGGSQDKGDVFDNLFTPEQNPTQQQQIKSQQVKQVPVELKNPQSLKDSVEEKQIKDQQVNLEIRNQENLKAQQELKSNTENEVKDFIKSLKQKYTKKISVQEYVEQQQKVISDTQSKISIYKSKVEALNTVVNDDTTELNKKQISRYKKVISGYESQISKLETALESAQKNLASVQNTSPNEEIEVENKEELVEELNEKTGVDLSVEEGSNLIEQLEEAAEEIPAFDFEIGGEGLSGLNIVVDKKTRNKSTGYYRTVVNIKSNDIPPIINKIATYVKTMSKGLVAPRVTDLRVIGNTNKTQLRNSKLKLTTRTITFKPNPAKLKVNKSNRIMLSFPEDYSSSNPSLLVYIQESRAKSIIEVSSEGFDSIESYISFVGERIAEYYTMGYQATYHKFQTKNISNPYIDVIRTLLATHDYKIKIIADNDDNIQGFLVKTTGTDNEWLNVMVRESSIDGIYEVVGYDTVRGNEISVFNSSVKITQNWLNDNLLKTVNELFKRDWSNEIEDLDSVYYELKKLKHAKLGNFGFYIINNQEKLETELIRTVSKNEMKKIQSGDYDAETLMGEGKYIGKWALTYFAMQIVGGDKRHGSEYITSDDYYSKYSVKDTRSYENRKRIKKNPEENYNSRPYVFMLKYVINGKPITLISKDLNYIISESGMFTNNPNTNPVSEYDYNSK